MSVIVVRTLPLRVTPAAGEAIDSWLERIAHRSNVTWQELRITQGRVIPAKTYADRWTGRLTAQQCTTLSMVTGVDPDALRSMTLESYSAIAAGFEPYTGREAAVYPWRHCHASRFCPFCLMETGGAWRLVWRMVWFFACPRHHCLLAHRCPECGAAQRRQPVSGVVPQPGRCLALVGPSGKDVGLRCGADLTKAPVIALAPTSTLLAVQAVIAETILHDQANFGIYQSIPTSAPQVLADLRAIGERYLSALDHGTVSPQFPATLIKEYRKFRDEERTTVGRRPARAVPAVITAIGTTAAIAIVGQRDLRSAGAVLTSIWPPGKQREISLSINITGRQGCNTSPALRGSYLEALGPNLGVPEQLRCRLGTPLPAKPTTNPDLVRMMATRIPTMLWPQWSLRLAEPQLFQRFLRPALSAGLLIVGTDIKVEDAVALLGCPFAPTNVIAAMYKLSQSPHWQEIRSALYQLSDYLRVHGSPINYRRRRRLNFGKVLPETTWRSICRETRTRPEGIAAVRQFLIERLTGTSLFPAPLPKHLEAHYSAVNRIPLRLTPELNAALIRHAEYFLACEGVRNEPVQWAPPIALLDGIHLPHSGNRVTDTQEMHRLVNLWRHGNLSIAAIPKWLGVSPDVFRQACEENPTPQEPRRACSRTVPKPRPAYAMARAALPPDRLRQLYEAEGQSLRGIGASIGVSRQTVVQLAHEYGIVITPHGRGKYQVDPQWLRQQYTEKKRSLSEISAECGVSVGCIVSAARRAQIPMRGLSRRSAEEVLADSNVPRWLVPAMTTQGGWERLRRLPDIASHESFAAAGRALGVPGFSLGAQVALIERDLGGPVLIRAAEHHPLRLTSRGKKVVAAVTALQKSGWPAAS
jgi:hypothetical protein